MSAALQPGQLGREVAEIPVPISYDIIRLFSEGLYKSPHKAVEELVTNGYDADAREVRVLLPDQDPAEAPAPTTRLWVIDDGRGMNQEGFQKLWRIARSDKADAPGSEARPPIGQFGIGKLAAYVIARNLLHLSRVDNQLLLTEMDFRRVEKVELDDEPVTVSLRRISETEAKRLLADIRAREPDAWGLMFGDHRASHWTAAGLSDFRELYQRLVSGVLRWVLRTGLPLHSNFRVYLDRERLTSSKAEGTPILEVPICEQLPTLGPVKGQAQIFGEKLTGGKSEQYGRSNGFFIRVRGRVVNLEDELFGLKAQNHAAWSRFALDVEANGLRDHLLSSREGFRDSEHVREFRELLLKIFNQCRAAYDKRKAEENTELDVAQLLSYAPRAEIAEPILQAVRGAVETSHGSFYVAQPERAQESGGHWTEESEDHICDKPIASFEFVEDGPNAAALRYEPDSRVLRVNSQHPFVDKLIGTSGRPAAEMFAGSEVVLEGQLSLQGINLATVAELLATRDRVLRLMAGKAPATAAEVLRRLRAASNSEEAFEVAVGAVFLALGFQYERKGGNQPGPDGLLHARLGRHAESSADYSLVYDAKTTTGPKAVPAAKVDFASLERFRTEAGATFGFFIADRYAGECDPCSALSRELRQSGFSALSLLKIEHLERLVRLHYLHGVPLTELRRLFESSRSVLDANCWVENLKHQRSERHVPLKVLLDGLEGLKTDARAKPSIAAVRERVAELKEFSPEELRARLRAVEAILGSRWLEVEDDYTVRMHSDSTQILQQLNTEIQGIPELASTDKAAEERY